ncbi:hypothetical protein GIB67_007498 [Kingdonia uniflora]|uniref:Retrotransposon gag domain-containing protein n=1 Tax=Kingdonia uniflora TaxID=39325 RepID=A0A7J7LW44_9MAGN|nr:hypothetical protein GIB67_007498 [Kingdonia uniflora]
METNGMQSGILPGMLGLEMPLHPHHHQQPQQQHPNHQNHQYPPHLHQHMVTFASHDPEHHTQSVKPSAYTYPSKSKQPPAPAPPQQMTLSDEDEHGFAGDENGGDGRKRVSTWQRVKWTDNMVRILIMMVFYVGDDNLPEASNLDLSSACKKKAGGLLQKKGKWKSVSRAMMEKEFYVSPQQCEDKFNDLNKRYKRVNDILGKGTACKVVENQNLLESMDHLSPKMKDEARKLLNSKHLFFREMCAYHNSGSNGGGGGGVPHQSLEMAMESHNSQQQRCFHSPEAGATHELQPSIHLGGEVHSDISRGPRPSKHQEEEQRPQSHILTRNRLSKGTNTHNPQPPRQATQTTHHYVTQEQVDQHIKELIEAQALGNKDYLAKLQGSPIAKELFNMEIPKGFHTPKIRNYKGTDPKEHIQQYLDSLGLYSNLNHILCRLFTTSLQGEPLRWFHSLLEDSILTFDQLQKQFIKMYAHNKDKEENLYYVISLKHSQGEKLETFAKKFLELTRKVDNLDQKIVVTAFTNALQLDCKAKEHLFLNKPATLEDMITKRLLEYIFKDWRIFEYIIDLESYKNGSYKMQIEVVQVESQAPPARDRDQLPETSHISARKRLGPRGVASKAISRNLPHEPQPSIHLGGEVQSEVSRCHQNSIRQEEDQRPLHQVPTRDRLSEGTRTHHPLPARPTIQSTRHYVTKEHIDQQIKELTAAQVLGSTGDTTKLQGSLIAKELFDMEIPKGFHTPKICKYKGTDPKEHIQQYRDSLELYSNLNHILCRLFATSLQEKPL